MLTVISGAYRPDLEDAFLARILELKKDPLAPINVVVPTSLLTERLQRLLAQKETPFLNITFHTFASLSEEILAGEGPLDKPVLNDPLFFDALIGQIQKDDRPFEYFEDLAVPDGFPSSVKSTLQDLLEAGVDESNAREAIGEEFLGQDVDKGTLRQLLSLYRLYLKRVRALPVYPRTALLKESTSRAPESAYLKNFKETIFYGFYDLNGLQADFFQAIVKHHPCRLYLPYVHEHPAYAFVSRFRDTFLQPVITEEVRLDGQNGVATPFHVINVSGLRDEAWAIAAEILKWRGKGVAFADMAIVYRSRERISETLLSVLREHFIPIRLPAPGSLEGSPLLEAAHHLLRTMDSPPGPFDFLDFLGHPDFVFIEPFKPEPWPEKAPWADFVKKAVAVLDAHFRPQSDAAKAARPLMMDALDKLSRYALIAKQTSRREFLEALRDRWMNLQEPFERAAVPGVSILFAEVARGLSFKVVFLAGVEEKVFPRLIREDPFLRDDARLALNNTLGYKIPQKMTAHEEERLLFHLFTHAATQHLTLLYQRSDDEGNVVGPSSFMRAFLSEQGKTVEKEARAFPRPFLAKFKEIQPAFLSVHGLVSRYLSAGLEDEAVAFLKLAEMPHETLQRQAAFVRAIARRGEPGPYDGLLGPSAADAVLKKDLSPSKIETYGECPFKFFATRILNLEPLERKETEEGLEPKIQGKLVHGFLEVFYRFLTDNGAKSLPGEFPEKIFEKTFHDVFHAPAALVVDGKEVALHPILWEALRSGLKQELRDFVERDLADCLANGYAPRFFEEKVAGRLAAPLDEPNWLGIMDRIDVSSSGARVVDYKTGRFYLKTKTVTLALRGRKSQPPVYILLSEKFLLEKFGSKLDVHFTYKRIRHDEPGKDSLSPAEWRANRSGIVDTLQTQLGLLKRGVFSLYSDPDYCSHCDMSSICRRTHMPTLSRSFRGPGEIITTLRAKKAARKAGESE